MALNVVRYNKGNSVAWGVVKNGLITPIEGDYETTGDFVTRGAPLARALANGGLKPTLEEKDVCILSPVTHNQQYICQGVNYRSHLLEAGMDPDAKNFNMIFRKASSCIAPACSPIRKPKHVRLLDYEIELALIIGKEITDPVEVTDENLHEYVAGITINNDVSARDVQVPQMQFYKGKSYRTFGPTGPYLCLIDRSDVPLLRRLEMTLSVNDRVRQHASTGEMLYAPAETLTELSGLQDLFPGDMLATGTPAGVALKAPGGAAGSVAGLIPEKFKWPLFIRTQERSGRYLKIGDSIESRIRSEDGSIDLGLQRNEVVG